MKKKFAALLAAAMTVGAASTTFAAANPFSDVPAGHWAYDAVAQLAADGVIEGYGDGTFRGEQSITRYEMAQMIAKAMAKNPSGVDKAMLDRLAAEFREELNNLGVRVSNLEKHADMVNWTGELRYIYKSDHNENQRKNDLNRMELRLFPTAEVNDHWSVKARLTGRLNMKDDSSSDLRLTYVFAEGKYDKFKVALGKMSNFSTNDEGLVSDDFFSGVQLSYGDKLKAVLEAGRWDMTRGDGAGTEFRRDFAANYQGIQLNYHGRKFFGGLGYRHFASDGFRNVAGYSNGNDEASANIFSVGARYSFDNNVHIAGAFAKNTKADNLDTSHSLKLGYKVAKKAIAGTWGAHVAYRYVSKNVSFAPTYVTMFSENHRKGWELGVEYVPFKNVLADVSYFHGKKLDTGFDSKTLFGRVRWYF